MQQRGASGDVRNRLGDRLPPTRVAAVMLREILSRALVAWTLAWALTSGPGRAMAQAGSDDLSAIAEALQDGGGEDGELEDRELAGDGAGGPSTGPTGSVTIVSARAGVGGAVRQGEWAAIKVALSDARGAGRDVLVRVVGYDPDGDEAMYERSMVSTQSGWVYVRLPYRTLQNDSLEVRVFEARASGDPWFGGLPGAWAGAGGVTLSEVLPGNVSMIGVIGRAELGLGGYEQGVPNEFRPSGHELTRVVTGIEVQRDLPDRWHGLASYEVLVWGSSVDAFAPELLATDQASAIREWVERGGHLVVMMPSVGSAWLGAERNLLSALMPDVRLLERRAVTEADSIRVLVARPDPLDRLPLDRLTLRPMVPADDAGSGAGGAMPVMATADGTCFVMRRAVGVGAVTLVSLDVQGLVGGLPRVDQFWHRVLGRRNEVYDKAELDARLGSQNALPRSREPRLLDSDLSQRVNLSGAAVQGVLLGVVLFAAYWVVAGPGGFAWLSRSGRKQHAWVAFVGAAGLFTALAWGGAAAFTDKKLGGRYVAFLDQVHGQDVQRGRAWATVLLPGYGDADLSLIDPAERGEGTRRRFEPLVAAWRERVSEPSGRALFPNTRAYAIASQQPGRYLVPSRDTAKPLRLDWATTVTRAASPSVAAGAASTDGPEVPAWQFPRPLGEPGDLAEPTITLNPAAGVTGRHAHLSGRLTHGLPGPIERMDIIVNEGQAGPWPRVGNRLIPRVWRYSLTRAWKAGEVLDLAAATATADAATRVTLSGDRWLGANNGLIRDGLRAQATAAVYNETAAFNRAVAMSLVHQFGMPTASSNDLVQRFASHGLSLDVWLTQPSVMLIGVVRTGEDVPSPVPLRSGSRVVPLEGETYVRWVYPLTPMPVIPQADEADDADSPDQDAPDQPSPADPSDPRPSAPASPGA